MATPLKIITQYTSLHLGFNRISDVGMYDLVKGNFNQLI